MEKKWHVAWSAVGMAVWMSFAGAAGFAQKTAPVRAIAKPMVPDNPSPHPAPEQPLPYSHKQHLAFSLPCAKCHTNPEPGRLMTFPETATCMKCHASFGKNRPSIQKLAGYDKSKTAVPWVRVYAVLPGVAWSHRRHLDAGMKCEMCHG